MTDNDNLGRCGLCDDACWVALVKQRDELAKQLDDEREARVADRASRDKVLRECESEIERLKAIVHKDGAELDRFMDKFDEAMERWPRLEDTK